MAEQEFRAAKSSSTPAAGKKFRKTNNTFPAIGVAVADV
jgi:hypothetical protein